MSATRTAAWLANLIAATRAPVGQSNGSDCAKGYCCETAEVWVLPPLRTLGLASATCPLLLEKRGPGGSATMNSFLQRACECSHHCLANLLCISAWPRERTHVSPLLGSWAVLAQGPTTVLPEDHATNLTGSYLPHI